MPAARWTKDDEQEMRGLLDQGLSFAETAVAMGRTKGSCIGRAHRLGWLTSREATVIDAKRARKPPPKPTAVVIQFPQQKTAARYELPEASTTAYGQPKSIIGLKEHHCRYPVHVSERSGRQLFCAAEKRPGSSYCEGHHQLCWRPCKRHGTDLQRMARAYR